jgi:spoIIIJ-associated protein
MESVEASGKSIEDAILQALARLGRNRNEVEIAVLQEPSRGTRGMGARDARVRVFVKPGAPARPLPSGVPAPESIGGAGEDALEEADALLDEADAYVVENGYDEEAYAEEEVEYAPLDIPIGALKDLLPADASIEEMAVEALRAILAHMGMRALVEVREPEGETDEEAEEEPLTLNIRSDDAQTLSLLIGRRGETLAALQLLVNLIVNKQTGVREHIIVDAEGYRERRERNLRSMAARVADQVRRSGAPVMLEAMPPNERRIIHMALAETGDISTESTGEGDQRRVVVSLKHPAHA